MAKKREFTKVSSEVIEQVVKNSLELVGLSNVKNNQIQLLTRLIFATLGRYYFYNPDIIIQLGFMKFEKSPDKDELLKIMLIRDIDTGVINADTLWKYYKGDIRKEKDFKKIMDQYFEGLINYSQEQEMEITSLASQLQEKKRRT